MSAPARPFAAATRNCTRRKRPFIELTGARNFSSSARYTRSHDLPVFKESSSPELDARLSTMRDKIFIPGYLNPAQKKLVIGRKYASQLEHDPTFATIGHEEVRLEHVDVQKDVPNHWQAFNKAILLAETSQDWVNMIAVLEGFHNSHMGHKVRSMWKEKFVRKACENDQIGIVIQALRMVERNGLSMKDPGVRFQVFKGILGDTKAAGWSKSALTRNLAYTEEAINLLEHPGHCGSRVVDGEDGRIDPFVVGVYLELAARKATVTQDFANALVGTLATRLASILEQEKTLDHDAASTVYKPTTPQKGSKLFIAKSKAYGLNQRIETWLPVYTAFALVLTSFSKTIPKGIDQIIQNQLQRLENRLDACASEFHQQLTAQPEVKERLLPCEAVQEWERIMNAKKTAR